MEPGVVLPATIETEQQLEELMTEPSDDLLEALSKIEGDLMILGVGGKMGPTLANLAKRAFEESASKRNVIGVSRFSDPRARERLETFGVRTLHCDLLSRRDIGRLPDVPNIVFMAGMKFGTTGDQATTWAMNALAPGYVAAHFPRSQFVVFSTGNVYPFTPVGSGGATEEIPPEPVGEYAQSALARERIFEYFSHTNETPVSIIRLNYAIDLRYGVLLDIAQKVWNTEPIDLTMGHVNIIWQGDANRQVLKSLVRCSSPPSVFNVTGPETLSVRRLARDFGGIFGKQPVFEGNEAQTALLSNSEKANRTFGPPQVEVSRLVQWVAHWVSEGGPTLGKPTHFETRDGKF